MYAHKYSDEQKGYHMENRMKRKSIKLLTLLAIFVILLHDIGIIPISAANLDISDNQDVQVREVDFSQFSNSDFASDDDTTIILAEGIKFITSGSSGEKPTIETGTWYDSEAGSYTSRLNTKGARKWKNDDTELLRAIIIEDVRPGDKIEIVYGSSSKGRGLSELIGLDGSGVEGEIVLTAAATHTPYKYTMTAEESGTYYYYNTKGTYHIYAVKITGSSLSTSYANYVNAYADDRTSICFYEINYYK